MPSLKSLRLSPGRVGLFIVSLIVLAIAYIFQRFDYFHFITVQLPLDSSQWHAYYAFAVNKTVRLIMNDIACCGLIFAIFGERKYLRVAFAMFIFELLILLPLYLTIKLTLEGDSEISSPLLSQFHRLIINPMLMILLIFGLFYQRYFTKR